MSGLVCLDSVGNYPKNPQTRYTFAALQRRGKPISFFRGSFTWNRPRAGELHRPGGTFRPLDMAARVYLGSSSSSVSRIRPRETSRCQKEIPRVLPGKALQQGTMTFYLQVLHQQCPYHAEELLVGSKEIDVALVL